MKEEGICAPFKGKRRRNDNGPAKGRHRRQARGSERYEQRCGTAHGNPRVRGETLVRILASTPDDPREFAWIGSRTQGPMMPKRHSNDPRRHILAAGELSTVDRERLLRETRYLGSGLHKKDRDRYSFTEPCTPRLHKTMCDLKRPIDFDEARELFAQGIGRGMISKKMIDGFPVFVWSVDADGEVYEAKPNDNAKVYHGYPLGPRDGVFPELVRREWKRRSR